MKIQWSSSNSPQAFVAEAVIPDGITLPVRGLWCRHEAGRETTYRLDTDRSADDWLALAVAGKLLRATPLQQRHTGNAPLVSEEAVKVVACHEGAHYDLTVCYVRPGTAVSFATGYKRRGRWSVVITGAGETRPATPEDFVEPEVLLP